MTKKKTGIKGPLHAEMIKKILRLTKMQIAVKKSSNREAWNRYRLQHKVKLSILHTGNTRLTHGHLITRNYKQSACTTGTCRNYRLTVKYCLESAHKARIAEENKISIAICKYC